MSKEQVNVNHIEKDKDIFLQSGCPENIISACSFGKCKHRRTDATYAIEKVQELISEPVTRAGSSRILRLLSDYIDAIDVEGYKMKHLPAVMNVIEFLGSKGTEMKEYKIYFDRFLDVLKKPPLFEKSSEILTSSEIMQEYFTFFGYLLASSPTRMCLRKINEALRALLIEKKSSKSGEANIEFCRDAVERSRLPIIITELLEASLPSTYTAILELVFSLSSISDTCSSRMLKAGILNPLLIRMDLSYGTQPYCLPPSDLPAEGPEYPDDTMLLIMSVLWALMRSILPAAKSPDNSLDLPSLERCATWGLRSAFKRYVRTSHCSGKRVKIRNEIAGFILAGAVCLPSWNLVSGGVADDVILLLSAHVINRKNSWAEGVKFSASNEDLFFKNTLLFILCYLTRISACTFIFAEKMSVSAVLRIIDPCTDETTAEPWSDSQLRYLSERAMYTITLLGRKTPAEFVRHNGALKLLTIIERSLTLKSDVQLLMTCARTICSIVVEKNSMILDDFRKHDSCIILIRAIFSVLDMKTMGTQHRRILTLLLMSLDALMAEKVSLHQSLGEQSLRIVSTVLRGYLEKKIDDSEVDQSLLLAAGSFLWGTISWCPGNLQPSVESGIIHTLLDIIETAKYPVCLLYLGILADMCEEHFCLPYFCSWRGIDKEGGLMSLLARIWREEERRIGVKRNDIGSVEDVELPQMGQKQMLETYGTELSDDYSPAIGDLIGSIRSRIYAIKKVIEEHRGRYEMAKDRYKILLANLPVEDRITMLFVELYLQLKVGEIWIEIKRYFEQEGIIPVSADGQLMFLMVQAHYTWSLFLRERHEKIILQSKDAEIREEKEEFAKIRDSKLASTLEALEEIERIRRTVDPSYLREKKERQRKQVDSSRGSPTDRNVQSHRTYQEIASVTNATGLQFSVKSRFSEHKIRPVSPTDSQETPILLTMSNVSLSSKCLSTEKLQYRTKSK